jgi:hypothetical protein
MEPIPSGIVQSDVGRRLRIGSVAWVLPEGKRDAAGHDALEGGRLTDQSCGGMP